MEKSNRRAAAIDVDGSTFKTEYFREILPKALACLYPPQIVQTQFTAEITQFYVPKQGYDFKMHIEHYGIKFDLARANLIDALSKYELIFDDALAMYDRLDRNPYTDMWNVTVGVRGTQELKVELMRRELKRRLQRRLRPIGCIVVDWNKGEYLSELWASGFTMGGKSYSSALLIEDHPEQIKTLAPRPGLEIYQVVRKGAKYPAIIGRDDVHQIPELGPIS